MEQDDAPPIAALFVVVFDQKVGYTLSWNRSLPDISLDGVEYKSLPSGLHGVKEDLVYFVHGAYAGVSAFVQEESDEQHRNASFVATGALVSLRYGRLGKSWLHAGELRRLARTTVKDVRDTRALELYWEDKKLAEAADAEAPTPSELRRMSLPPGLECRRDRAQSSASAGPDGEHSIASDHPALAISELLDTFGPLIFPLYRAALVRKRILFLGVPPVQRSCNFVYDLSILSSVPQSCSELLQPGSDNALRSQPLFSVGVHDIPCLMEQARKARWLACTTDDILGEKHQLYDVLVTLPAVLESNVRRWPIIRTAEGAQVKATQRDLRRYRLLCAELDHQKPSRHHYSDTGNASATGHIAPLMRASTEALLHEVKQTEAGESEVVEPTSWTAMAYNGVMWWASAGEMEAWENEETRTDRELLEEIPDSEDLMRHITRRSDDLDGGDTEQLAHKRASAVATIVTAYFHRLTAQILEPLADIVGDADDDTEEGVAETQVLIAVDDIRAMGLDSWSEADRNFAKEAMELYFGREAKIQEGGIKICGVRIC